MSGLQSIAAGFQTRTLRENIGEVLVEAILSGKLRPGDRLNESELARTLKVSRAPIREALQQLQEQGLVVNQPRRGMFVVSLDDEELQKINSLRLVLEAEALRLCAQHATVSELRKLRQISERMERTRNFTAIEAVRIDLEFHRTMWSFSRNEYLEKTLTSLTAPLFAYAVLTRPKEEKMRMILDSHSPMVEYASGRSSKTAEQIIFDHLSLRWQQPNRFASQPDR